MECYGARRLTMSPWLDPGQPLVAAVGGRRGAVRRKGPSLLGPFGLPGWVSLPFLVSPDWGGENFSPPPRFHGRSARWSHRMMIPIEPCVGDPFGSPRPSSWSSSPAPCKVPESASPLGERLQDLRAGGLGNQAAPLSLSSPVNDIEA